MKYRKHTKEASTSAAVILPVKCLALVLFTLLLGVSIYVHFTIGFWSDQDWELLVAREWLEGKKLYIDQVPVSAPLIFYIDALPVLLSRHVPFLLDSEAL